MERAPCSENLRTAVFRNLGHLTDYERDLIKQVLKRDEQLRRKHDQRVNTLKVELDNLRRNLEAKADLQDSSYACTVCAKQLGRFFSNNRSSCSGCFRVVCVTCTLVVDGPLKQAFCLLCAKGWEIWQTSGEWVERRPGITRSPMADFILREGFSRSHSLKTDSTSAPQVDKGSGVAVGVARGRKLQRLPDSVDGKANFLRRSLHINAQFSQEPRSEHSVLSPLRKNINKLENQVFRGLRRVAQSDALLFQHSESIPPAVDGESKRTSKNDERVTANSGATYVETSLAETGKESVLPIGHDIEIIPRHPSKRLNSKSEEESGKLKTKIAEEIPMKNSDPQLRLAFNYDDGQLEVYIMRCRNLPSLRKSKVAPPSAYVKVHLVASKGVKIKRKTRTISKTADPEYDEVLKFPVDRTGLANWKLSVSVCAKKGLFRTTTVLEEASMVVSEDYLRMEYPIWIHFHSR